MRKLVSTDNIKKEGWLEARRKGIGGSDIGAILGVNSFCSPLEVYLDKTGQMPEDKEENIAAELGLELEPFLSKKFTGWISKNEGLDIELKKMQFILQDDMVDYFLVNLDRWFEHPSRGNCLVELKTTTEFKRTLWREDNIPDQYYLQCQWQLMITGWKFCYIAFLIGNRTFDVKIIPRNETVIENMRKIGTIFWEQNVLDNKPPAPIGLASDTEALKLLYPEEFQGNEKLLTPAEEKEIIENIEIINEQKIVTKTAKSVGDTAQQKIKAIIGDNEYTQAGPNMILFKTIIVPEKVVNQYTFRRLFINDLSK
ncbi:hypothetical protein ES708_30837 [subsurface metagenome]